MIRKRIQERRDARVSGVTWEDDATKQDASKAFVLGCIDWRTQRATLRHLYRHGEDAYKFTLAGAGLGYIDGAHPNWTTSFDENIAIASSLSEIDTIIIFQHEDCGYVRATLGDLDPVAMRAANTRAARNCVAKMRADPALAHITRYEAHYVDQVRPGVWRTDPIPLE